MPTWPRVAVPTIARAARPAGACLASIMLLAASLALPALSQTCAGGGCHAGQRDGEVSPPARVPRCVPQCRCSNGLMIIGTGQWSPEQGCHQVVRRCGRGCLCTPEPRCK